MTVLHPCLHCHRKADCSVRSGLLAKIKGANLSKATVRCKIPEQDFPPGTVVMVRAFEMVENGSSYPGPEYVRADTSRRAVVAGWRNRLAQVVIDKDQEIWQPEGNSIAYLKVPSDRLTRLDEPVRELCKCGLSLERCENRDLPSVRDGKWFCKEEAIG